MLFSTWPWQFQHRASSAASTSQGIPSLERVPEDEDALLLDDEDALLDEDAPPDVDDDDPPLPELDTVVSEPPDPPLLALDTVVPAPPLPALDTVLPDPPAPDPPLPALEDVAMDPPVPVPDVDSHAATHTAPATAIQSQLLGLTFPLRSSGNGASAHLP
ncbi:MAG: hypothetical protein QM820_11245 [Minicystis sp.]